MENNNAAVPVESVPHKGQPVSSPKLCVPSCFEILKTRAIENGAFQS